ncbi:MAG: M20/M25/M40 family metallo-hydrolase [Candidatus Dojkabacteria bacterium]
MSLDNLEQVKLLTSREIVERLTRIDVQTSDDDLARLIKDMSAMFVSYNTVTGNKSSEVLQLVSLISQLVEPLLSNNYIKWRGEAVPFERRSLPFIFIMPPEEEDTVKQIASRYYGLSNLNSPVTVKIPLLHAHMDTTHLIEEYGALTTYIKNEDNLQDSLLYGRGVVDMKSQIAVIVVLLYLLHSLGKNPPMILLTADEEYSSPASLGMLSYIYPTNLNIDFEPSDPEYYVDEISPTVILEYMLGDRKKPEGVDWILKTSSFKVLEKLGQQIRLLADYYYPDPEYSVNVTAEPGIVTISIMDLRNYVALKIVKREFVEAVLERIQNYFETPSGLIAEHACFHSEISVGHKATLEKVLNRRKRKDKLKRSETLTSILYSETNRKALLVHRFASFFTLGLGRIAVENTVIMGPRELGMGRHSAQEVLKLEDDLVLLKNVLEILSDGEEVFIEA